MFLGSVKLVLGLLFGSSLHHLLQVMLAFLTIAFQQLTGDLQEVESRFGLRTMLLLVSHYLQSLRASSAFTISKSHHNAGRHDGSSTKSLSLYRESYVRQRGRVEA